MTQPNEPEPETRFSLLSTKLRDFFRPGKRQRPVARLQRAQTRLEPALQQERQVLQFCQKSLPSTNISGSDEMSRKAPTGFQSRQTPLKVVFEIRLTHEAKGRQEKSQKKEPYHIASAFQSA